MGISGNLQTMDLSELLQWLSQGRKTGTLEVEDGEIRKLIYFDSGAIFSSASTDPKEHLGSYLASHGLVTDAEVDAAVALQEVKQELLGKILVDMESITEDQLQAVLQAKAEESIFDIFTWNAGEFRFIDGQLPEQTMVRMNLDVHYIILEGSRRVDEWNVIRERIPSPQSVVVSVADLDDESIDQTDRRIFAWVDDQRTLEEISSESRTSLFQVAQAVATQVETGRIKVVRPRITEKIVEKVVEKIVEVEVSAPAPQISQATVQSPPSVMSQSESPRPASAQQDSGSFVVSPSEAAAIPSSPDHSVRVPPSPELGGTSKTSESVDLGTGRTLHFATSSNPPTDGGFTQAESRVSPESVPEPAAPPPTMAAEPPADEAEQALDSAHAALTEGRLDEALSGFREARDLGSDNRQVKREASSGEDSVERALDQAGIRLSTIPRLECGMDELMNLDISPQEGFMLSRANGSYTLKEILKMSPTPELDARMLLWRLKRSGHIGI